MVNRTAIKGKWSCPHCKTAFTLKGTLVRHEKRREAQGTCHAKAKGEFECPHCKTVYRQKRNLQSHLKKRQNQGNRCFVQVGEHICNECETSFKSERGLKLHKARFGGTGQCKPRRKPIVNTEKMELEYKCRFCHLIFDDSRKLAHHSRMHYNNDDQDELQPGIANYECHICHQLLSRDENLQKHLERHASDTSFMGHFKRATVGSDGENIYRCDPCGLEFTCGWNLLVHSLRFHNKVKVLQDMRKSHKVASDPLMRNKKVRRESARRIEDSTFIRECQWTQDWLTVHMQRLVDIRNDATYGVYLAAVLGPGFEKGMKISEFITENPSQVLLYWGKTSGGRDINDRHTKHPESSSLAQASLSGLEVVCLHRNEFKGQWEDKTQEMEENEAALIMTTLIDAEYEALPGTVQYKYMNQHREIGPLMTVGDDMLRLYIRVALAGNQLLCCDESCNTRCGAMIHPDWTADLIVDMTKAKKHNGSTKETNDYYQDMQEDDIQDNHEENMEIDDSVEQPSKELVRLEKVKGFKSLPVFNVSHKKKRPSESQTETFVENHLQQLKSAFGRYDPAHYCYTVITTDPDEIPGNSVRKICSKILEESSKDVAVPIYVGVNSSNDMASYETHAVRKEIAEGKIAIRVDVQKFENRRLARMEESLRLLHIFIQQRFKKEGIHFNALNKHMEWIWLSCCTPEQILEVIAFGLTGESPINLGGTVGQLSCTTNYPVDLKRRLLKGEIQQVNK